MYRRTVLTMCGASLVGLAGCGGDQSENGTESPDETPIEEPTTAGTPTEAPQVEAASLQRAVFTGVDGGYELFEAPDSQYLFLTGDGVTGEFPTFQYSDTEFSPGSSSSSPVTRAPTEFSSDSSDSGWVVFELPTAGDASDAEFTNGDITWQPNEDLRSRLTAPITEVDVVEFDISVLSDGRPEFTVTVYNSGINPSRFLGRIKRSNAADDLEQVVSREVPSKETVTLTATADEAGTPEPGGGISGSASYDLVWPDGREFVTYPE